MQNYNKAVLGEYTYDVSGLRISKSTSSGTARFVYDENKNLLFEVHDSYTLAFHYDESGLRTHFDYIHDGKSTTYFYRYNAQGDVIALVDSSGQVRMDYRYTAYGMQIRNPGMKSCTAGTLNPFRYRGYYYDTETNYYYLQSRYYNPYAGRFLNADDPTYLGATGSLLSFNLFAYCENDPVNFIDPCGHKPGDLFKTIDRAVINLADYINPFSIRNGWEYFSYIYLVAVERHMGPYMTYYEYRFTYFEPWTDFEHDSVSTRYNEYFTTLKILVAWVHTHGSWCTCHDSESFSGYDIDVSKQHGMDAYVVTPAGKIKNIPIQQESSMYAIMKRIMIIDHCLRLDGFLKEDTSVLGVSTKFQRKG